MLWTQHKACENDKNLDLEVTCAFVLFNSCETGTLKRGMKGCSSANMCLHRINGLTYFYLLLSPVTHLPHQRLPATHRKPRRPSSQNHHSAFWHFQTIAALIFSYFTRPHTMARPSHSQCLHAPGVISFHFINPPGLSALGHYKTGQGEHTPVDQLAGPVEHCVWIPISQVDLRDGGRLHPCVIHFDITSKFLPPKVFCVTSFMCFPCHRHMLQ